MKKFILALVVFVSVLAIDRAHAQEKLRIDLGSISLQSGLVHIAKDRGLFAK